MGKLVDAEITLKSSVKYQWTKSTGETVTLEVSIEKPEQEGSHEEAAGD